MCMCECMVHTFFIVHVHYIHNRIKLNEGGISEIGSEKKRNGSADERIKYKILLSNKIE